MIGFAGVLAMREGVIPDTVKDELKKNVISKIKNFKELDNSNFYYISSCHSTNGISFDDENKLILFFFGKIKNLNEISVLINEHHANENTASILLKAYKKFGTSIFDKINGAFSLCVFNTQEKTVILSKDHIGMRPLFYFQTENTLFFGSEINFFKDFCKNGPQMNRDRVLHYLIYTSGYKSQTFFKDIFRVPAGNYIEISKDFKSTTQYNFYEYNKNDDLAEEAAKKLKKTLKRSILSDITDLDLIGSKLSGGLDSSTISGLLLKHLKNERIEFFSVIYTFLNREDLHKVDEKKYIQDFENFFRKKTNFIDFNNENIVSPYAYDLNDDEPNFIPNRYFDINLTKNVSDKGIKHIFDGFDGDSIISYGKSYLHDLGRDFKIKKLIIHKKQLEENGFIKKSSNLRFILKYLIKPRINKTTRRILGFFSILKNYVDSDLKILHKSEISNLDLITTKKNIGIKESGYKTAKEIHKNVLEWPVWELILDHSFFDASKFGVTEYFPFLDKEVIHTSLNTNPEHNIGNGYTRLILRNAMRNLLPKTIINRKNKSNISPVINNYFRKVKEEKLFFPEIVKNNSPLTGLIDKKVLRNIYKNQKVEDNMLLHRIISLHRWMERHNFKWK